MTQPNRPLSPHFQIYRPQITWVLSFAHRMTGLVLAAGGVVLSAWLVALAGGPVSFAQFMNALATVPGTLGLILITLCFFYHLANGIRHLFWDVGWGFELGQVTATGIAVLLAAVVLTATFLVLLLT